MATLSAVRTTVKTMLNDPDSVRWTSDMLDSYVAMAVEDLFRLRPDLLLDDEGALQLPAISVVPQRYAQSLADFACFRALTEDDADTSNSKKAKAYLDTYRLTLEV